MLGKIKIDNKQNIVHNAHLLDHSQKPDIRLTQTGPAADHIDDQMGHHEVVLNHRQMAGVGGIAALAIGHFHIFGECGRIHRQEEVF